MVIDNSTTSADKILRILGKNPKTTAELCAALAMSRQALRRHLTPLMDAGVVRRVGKGRATRYERVADPDHFSVVRAYAPAGLDEAQVCETFITELGRRLPRVLENSFKYAFTEMVNNAIDHADASKIEVVVEEFRPSALAITVRDDGIGLFERLRSAQDLPSHHAALEELSKGKLTTMPARHSGEGIFFTSKVANYFVAEANGMAWIVDNRRADQAVAPSEVIAGTRIQVELDAESPNDLEQIFNEYTSEHAFDRTRIRVQLFDIGPSFVSRSEAKRVMRGLERFREVVLDFRGVAMVGQAFADECFRVWPSEHVNTTVRAENANDFAAMMIRRAGS